MYTRYIYKSEHIEIIFRVFGWENKYRTEKHVCKKIEMKKKRKI